MEIIETSDRKDWFDVGLQTYTSEELQCSTQNMKLTSDWKGVDLSKRGVSATVNDMCPYFFYSELPIIGSTELSVNTPFFVGLMIW